MRKIVITDHRDEGYEMERDAFALEGVELFICPDSKNEDELIKMAADAEVIIFTSSKFGANVINSLENCKMIIRYGSGLDTVDIETASARGIYVCNSQNYGAFSVAEHAFALLLCVNRKLMLADKCVRDNLWDFNSITPLFSLRGKTLGILGFGNIGRLVSKLAGAFEMKVLACDPKVGPDVTDQYNIQLCGFDELIKNSDYISLHAPLTKQTKHIFNKSVFRKMKNSSVIINTGRGGLIDQNDLVEALKSGIIAGAGLDVFETEPPDSHSELFVMNNVVLTPHIAWYTEESVVNLHREVIDSVLKYLDGKYPDNVVNHISESN